MSNISNNISDTLDIVFDTEPEVTPQALEQDIVQETPEEKKLLTYEDYPIEDLLLYAGIDTHVTSNIIAKQFPRFVQEPAYIHLGDSGRINGKAKSLIEVYNDYTRPMFEFIVDLEINGIGYDPVENRRLHQSMIDEARILEHKIFSVIGKGINLDSGDDVRELLYGKMGFTAPYTTKSGEDSIDGGAMLLLAGMDPKDPGKYIAPDPAHQFLADMAKRKNLVSVHRSFIENYIDDYMDTDYRIRAKYNQFGTSTFRLSASEPSLQNVPRSFGVKKCFTVRDGYVFICFDFSSAEVKLLASICGDEEMLRAVNDGLDFHSFAASNMFGIPYDEFVHHLEDKTSPLRSDYKAKRQTSKALGFGILYGSSAGGIAMNLNISKAEAEHLISLYFGKFPKLRQYVERTHYAAQMNKFVVTPLGHRRQFYGTHGEFKSTAAYNAALRGSQNYVIQSSTAIVGAIAFAEISKRLKPLGGLCTATVHDSLEAEVPIEHLAEAIEIFFYYMNDWPQRQFEWLGLSIGCEGEIGFNWQDMTKVDRGISQEDAVAALLSTRK